MAPAAARKKGQATPLVRTFTLAFIFHLTLFCVYLYTYLWHFSDGAKQLPGAHGFGWFYRVSLPSHAMKILNGRSQPWGLGQPHGESGSTETWVSALLAALYLTTKCKGGCFLQYLCQCGQSETSLPVPSGC